MDMLFSNYLHTLTGNLFVRLVLWCVVLDTALGCLRAVKYRKWNSSVGIDGGIRKVAMVLSVLFLVLVDDMVGMDVLAWANADTRAVLTSMGIKSLGLAEFFCVVYVLYEATSIMKNMLLCGLPLPAGLREKVAKFLDTMTDETAINMQAEISGANKGAHRNRAPGHGTA